MREVEEPFASGQKGSSAMPHKRNPVKSEQVCGLARLLSGYAVTALENGALWHERDISHSSAERVILPDATAVLCYMIRLMTRIVSGLAVYPERMLKNMELTRGLAYSGQLLLDLTRKGVAREDAYQWVQRCSMKVGIRARIFCRSCRRIPTSPKSSPSRISVRGQSRIATAQCRQDLPPGLRLTCDRSIKISMETQPTTDRSA